MKNRTTRTTRTALTALTAIGAFAVSACSSGSTPVKEDKPAPPPYKITAQDSHGMQTVVTVQVDSTKNLKAVFDAVRADFTDDAGYFVSINCSSGNTEGYEHRLAVGKYAVGNEGRAATGLDDGGTEFETIKGATCP